MKKPFLSRLAAFVTVAATSVLVGCIKTDGKTTLNKDGSGVLSQRLEIDLTKLKELADMFKGFGGEPGAPGMDAPTTPTTPDDPADEFRKMEEKIKKVEGLTLKSFDATTKEGKTVVAYTIEFKEWSLLGKVDGVLMSSVELAKNADDSWTITFDPTSGQMGGGGGGAGGDMGGMDPAAFAPMLEPFMGAMELATSVTLPGAITETNGTKSEDGSTVSWKMGFKEILSAKTAGPQKVTFKGEALELKPFKFTPNVDAAKDMFGGGGKKHGGDAPKAPPAMPPEGGEKPADPK